LPANNALLNTANYIALWFYTTSQMVVC
jgi:hypothetical protein